MNALSLESDTYRRSLVVRRWRNVFGVSCACMALFLLATLFSSNILTPFYLPYPVIIAVPLLVLALGIILAPGRLLAAFGLRHVLMYPPYWVGVALGASGALAVLAYSDEFGVVYGLYSFQQRALATATVAVVALPVGALVASFVAGRFGRKRNPSEYLNDDIYWVQTPSANENVSAWLDDDAPVSRPSQDYFDARTTARRMAMRLLTPQKPSAQAVIGRLGSGKSTVRALVGTYLASHPQPVSIEVLCVELWPYATTQAAVEGILRVLVAALSTEIPTGQLAGLPAAYGMAIAKMGGVSEWIPSGLHGERVPATILRDLDDAATSINRRYVVWVEDLERFAAGDPHAEVSESEIERLAPVRAVLHGLDMSRSFTVVTATTDLYRRFDLEKISRYVERLGDLPRQQVHAVIGMLRRQWQEAKRYVDPVRAGTRSSLGWDQSESINGDRKFVFLGGYVSDLASAICIIARTPRSLKQGLRRARETWHVLAGEIDIDDVIAVSVLGEAFPQVVAAIDRNIASLQGRAMRISEPRQVDGLRELKEEVKQLRLDEVAHQAVDRILEALFDHDANRRPQGVKHYRHSDYWQRLQSPTAIAREDSDQRVLEIIRDGSEVAIAELLVDARAASAVEHFAAMMPATKIVSILAPLVERLAVDRKLNWPDGHAPGIIPLWRMLRARRSEVDLGGLTDSIVRLIEQLAPRDLSVVHELVYWFATEERQIEELLGDRQRERIHASTLSALISNFVDRPRELVDALSRAAPPVLLWLSWRIERVRKSLHRKGLPFAEWPAFSPTLERALAYAPTIMAPLLAPFVVAEVNSFGRREEYVYDRAHCAELFGDASAFAALMRTSVVGQVSDPRVVAVIDEVSSPSEDSAGTAPAIGGVDTHDLSASVARSVDIDGRAKHFARNLNERALFGDWYASLNQVPSEPPAASPNGALYPEYAAGGGEWRCLDLAMTQDGEWLPITVDGLGMYGHRQALMSGDGALFVARHSWPRAFRVHYEKPVRLEDVRAVFGPDVSQLCRAGVDYVALVASVCENRPATPLLHLLYEHAVAGRTQDAVSAVLAWLEERLTNGSWREIDDLLKAMDVAQVPDAVLVAVLTITVPAKQDLNERGSFLARTEQRLRERLGLERANALLEARR